MATTLNRRRPAGRPFRAMAWVAAAAAASLMLGGCSTRPVLVVGAAPDSSALREAVTRDALVEHLQVLQDAADANGGNRASGTPGYEASAAYVETRLREAGYEPVRQAFSHEGRGDSVVESFNILADTGGDPARTVVIGAHLDSVRQGPGINDNGSGVAAVLEVAIRLAESGTVPANMIRFAFWGGEEDGLYGSTHYVDGLSDAQAREQLANLNFDMVGSPNGAVMVYDGDAGPLAFDDPAPKGSADVERIFLDYFAAQGAAVESVDFNDDSDYQPFLDRDIPVGGLFTGDEEAKSGPEAAAHGGTPDLEYDPCYHRSCDTLDNVDADLLEDMADALMHAALALGSTKSG